MTTFAIPPEQITAEHLQRLVSNAVREGLQLDYKEALPGNSDDEKYEFLADVSSFANAIGGDLIFGIRERRGVDGRPTGEADSVVGLPGVNLDAERLRLENLIRDGIDLRIHGVTLAVIPRDPDPPCLLLRVPRSWSGLHMITFRNRSRFYGRTSAGKYQLDVTEIRRGFLAVEAARERIQRFRAERIARIIAGETPVPMGEAEKLIFHGIPLTPGDVWPQFRASRERDVVLRLRPIAGVVGGWHFNLDGFVVYTKRSDPNRQCYLQLFRDGGIEAVSQGVVEASRPGGRIPGHYMEQQLIEGIENFKNAWEMIGVVPPLALGIAISGVKGKRIWPVFDPHPAPEATFDRDVVVVPDVVADDLTAPADMLLRPLFDLIWNAGGWGESPHYRDGRWK